MENNYKSLFNVHEAAREVVHTGILKSTRNDFWGR